MLGMYSGFIAEGDLVFDVGANHGNRSEVFLSLGAKVVAFEPQPGCANDLRGKFSKDPNFTLVQKALGESAGKGVMRLCQADTISSMSDEWVDTVKKSGRFIDYRWEKALEVEVSTLDVEIEVHGRPTFVKIDVEGYESKVLSGLSTPVKVISFEFIPEDVQSATICVEHLSRLGDYRFNFSLGESMRFELPNDVDSEKLLATIKERSLKGSKDFGDIYAFLDVA